MKKRLLWGFFLAAYPFVGRGAEAPETVFESANKHYAEGNFAGAQAAYGELAARGYAGAPLYFNLGNAYFRQGQIGRARLWYERALRESPGDEDVLYNRELLRSQVGERADVRDWWADHVVLLSGLLGLANLFFFACCVGSLFRESETLWWGRWIGGVVLGVLVVAGGAAHRQAARPEAVVVAARVEARTGPSAAERVGFLVPEGQRVAWLEASGEWVQIGLPEKGLKGWVRAEAVEPVDFRDPAPAG